MKLQAKLILIVMPLIALSLLALGWMAHLQLRETAMQTTMREMASLLDQTSKNIASEIETAKANVKLFSSSIFLHKYLLTVDESVRYTLMQPRLIKLFSGYQGAYPHYGEIRVLLPDGYEDTRVTHTYRRNITEEEGDTPLFKTLQALDGDIYTTFFNNPDNQQTALLVAKKLYLKDPAISTREKPLFRGYLAVTVDLGFVNQLVSQNPVGNTGGIFVSDSQGKILFAHHNDMVGETLDPDLFKQLRDTTNSRLSVPGIYHSDQNLLQARLPHPEILLIAHLPEAELVMVSRKLGYLVAGIIFVAILVTTTLLYLLLKRLVITPIQRLSHAAQAIGSGKLQVDINLDRHDELGELAVSFREMSKNLQRSGDQIRRLAYQDSLTGLANRHRFTDYMRQTLTYAQRHGQRLAILFLDLDDFKRINDTLGHQAGDQALQVIAERLSMIVRKTDYPAHGESKRETSIVARLGGDEFVILLGDLKDLQHAAVVARRLLNALAMPLIISNHEFHLSASIGIATYPYDGDDVETLVKNGDIAMYHAKTQGKNAYQYFNESMNTVALERLIIENDLRKAIDRDEFVLYYQPIIEARGGELVGAEALVRWQHPTIGILAPDQFIPIAEETGLIVPIGEWVLRHACRQNKAWQTAGFEPIPVSINISNRQFTNPHLGHTVLATLAQTGLDPKYLNIELTESTIMHAEEKQADTLHKLKAMGVKISMDDFGTGYSSLSALRQLPIDTLKIDRSFVKDIVTNKDDAAIISAIVAMARSLNLEVIAEGVETESQLQLLRAKKCELIQGFLVSEPIPVDEFVSFFDKQPIIKTYPVVV